MTTYSGSRLVASDAEIEKLYTALFPHHAEAQALIGECTLLALETENLVELGSNAIAMGQLKVKAAHTLERIVVFEIAQVGRVSILGLKEKDLIASIAPIDDQLTKLIQQGAVLPAASKDMDWEAESDDGADFTQQPFYHNLQEIKTDLSRILDTIKMEAMLSFELKNSMNDFAMAGILNGSELDKWVRMISDDQIKRMTKHHLNVEAREVMHFMASELRGAWMAEVDKAKAAILEKESNEGALCEKCGFPGHISQDCFNDGRASSQSQGDATVYESAEESMLEDAIVSPINEDSIGGLPVIGSKCCML